jgi:hypothetical protein
MGSLLCKITTAFGRKKVHWGMPWHRKTDIHTPSAINQKRCFVKAWQCAGSTFAAGERMNHNISSWRALRWKMKMEQRKDILQSFDQICQKSAHSIQLNFNELT